MFFKQKLMPARTQALGSARGIADLDAMLVEPVGFKLLGRDHVMRPLSVEQFFRVTTKWAELEAIRADKEINVEALLDKYHEIISAAVPTVKREDMDKMSMQQIGAVLQLVVETVTGKIFATEEKKTLLSTRLSV